MYRQWETQLRQKKKERERKEQEKKDGKWMGKFMIGKYEPKKKKSEFFSISV